MTMQDPLKPRSEKNLVLLTSTFPFGIGEAFLESEIDHLVSSFDKVVILTKNIESKDSRFNAPNFTTVRINPTSTSVEKVISVLLFFRHLKFALTLLFTEIKYLFTAGEKSSPQIIGKIFHDLFKALLLSRIIRNTLAAHQLNSYVVLYSYWLTSSALATLFVERKSTVIKRVSRAHRGDILEEFQPEKYLTFRTQLVKGLDKVYSISMYGASVLKHKVKSSLHEKIEVSRLGTRLPSKIPIQKTSKTNIIVSCSFLIEVKRVHLIIEALTHIKDLSFQWIHFGDGPLRSELETLATKRLAPQNFEFKGAIKNVDLIKYYEENYVDLFLNTSSSEGIPVSIMEAQSFGIPVIATDAGGNNEIVSDQTGKLVANGISPEELSKHIISLLSLPQSENVELRKNVKMLWDERYNASKNFPTFTAQLLNL